LHLTRYEERLLEGEEGESVEKAMRLLVTLGDVFGAERLVEVRSAHVSGVSYLNLGEAGLDFLKEQAEAGAKTRIRATLNPAGMDLQRWKELAIPQSFAEKQLQVIAAFERIGVEVTCTCTPYLVGNEPRLDEQIAWAESSAISYSNSVIGARTNRETGPTTLASAVTGRAALYGYRLAENRLPTAVVEVEDPPRSRLEFSALGHVIGAQVGNGVPFIRGVTAPSLEDLKALGAAAATSGGVALYHVEGFTPESRGLAPLDLRSLEWFTVDRGILEEVISKLSVEVEKPITCLGCPHCSLRELEEAARLLEGKRLRRKLWVFTSRGVYADAERRGLVNLIERAGGKVFRDTCMVVAPVEEMGITEVSTNSCKAAQYLANRGIKVALGDVNSLLKEATK
jgi:predicted aconitase